jgi:hypothetical protein
VFYEAGRARVDELAVAGLLHNALRILSEHFSEGSTPMRNSTAGRPALKATVLVVAAAFALAATKPAGAPRRVATPGNSVSATDVLTYHNDNARTGQNLNETVLTPGNVGVTTFGKVGFFPVDGRVDAQPLYLSGVAFPGQGTHNVLYVASEHGSLYAFDADTGAVLWHVSLLLAGESPSDDRGCGQVTPEIGITSTPVIDRTRGPSGAIYVVAMSKNAAGSYFQRLHALSVTTGAELFGGPQDVHGSFPKTGGSVVFDAKQYEERAGLLLLNGQIITAWTSHCDDNPYTGWIMAYDASTLAQVSVLDVTPNGSEGAFWMAGAGPAADAQGNIYLLDGNGTFDTVLDGTGFPNQGDFGNAFLEVSTSSGLKVADYFATWDTVAKSSADTDLGSGGTLVLPDLIDGGGVTRHLAVGAGKDSHIYVVDRDSMGKFNSSSNQNYQDIDGALPGGVWSMPAYFNNAVYYGSVGSPIKRFAISNAKLSLTPSSTTGHSFGYPGATPGISANGNSNAILWAVENGNTAVLHAYDALNLSRELYNSSQAPSGRDAFGPGNKFITPTIVNGHVYVGTTDGVAAFGLLPAVIVLDSPVNGATVATNFTVSGWAIDRAAGAGTGIDLVDVWAYPNPGSGAPAVFLGQATYGGARPDIAAFFGARFTNSGFTLIPPGLAAGRYQITAFAHSVVTSTFAASASATVTVATLSNPAMVLDSPRPNSTVGHTVTFAGWAIDRGASSGTGMDQVLVWAYPGGGGAPQYVGAATYGIDRADIGALLGSQFTTSGFQMTVAVTPGAYTFVAFAHSTVANAYSSVAAPNVTVTATNPYVFIDTPGQNTTAPRPFTLSGWAVDTGASTGTGIDAIAVWAYPTGGAMPMFVGFGTYGASRPDIGALFGASRFTSSGYALTVTAALPQGQYDLVVFGHSTVTGGYTATGGVRVTVQ